jgi:glycine cleavage system H protein
MGDPCAVVESVKTASDIYSPLSGEVIETNDALETEPGTVNEDPYGDGWFFKIRLSNLDELDALLSPDDYAGQLN